VDVTFLFCCFYHCAHLRIKYEIGRQTQTNAMVKDVVPIAKANTVPSFVLVTDAVPTAQAQRVPRVAMVKDAVPAALAPTVPTAVPVRVAAQMPRSRIYHATTIRLNINASTTIRTMIVPGLEMHVLATRLVRRLVRRLVKDW
jgi:hypothetical protein